MKVPYAHILAFADRPFRGNPAAVIALPEWRDDATLQAIAAELSLPATTFLVGAEIRWFSPIREIGLCGHGTLAAGHFVLAGDPARESATFNTRDARALTVTRTGDGYALALPALPPSPEALPDIGVLAVETLRHAGGYHVYVLRDEAAVRAFTPGALPAGAQTTVTAPGTETDVVSRVFSPYEDAVTGSAHAVIAPYWAARLGRDRFTAFQASARGGRIDCRLDGDRVILTGGCVTVIEGTIFV
ncbi:PhzF family phenazine biosynthesis protein [Sphingomonas immobilis]|uniref:PhzF family phenazine biosynthesis protein n=1 Tax=Sphingomonas immobilis TaxID=3063997 RepID=A0ABT8ZZU8_9SPHN|nr:PhzF family phenazine biosynthesis protein [Sphingomonas sp. CA1-15]MDO7843100.1 PhzF family phenazine biosynthesis protein [Sphingomonas sp. CA1-15]